MLRQIAPAHILYLADVGLQNNILGVGGKLPELLQGSQAIGRLLDSGQEVTVLRGKSGKRLGRRLRSSSLASPPAESSGFKCSMKLTTALLFVMHTILLVGERQLEIDILAAGIVQDHQRVLRNVLLACVSHNRQKGVRGVGLGGEVKHSVTEAATGSKTCPSVKTGRTSSVSSSSSFSFREERNTSWMAR